MGMKKRKRRQQKVIAFKAYYDDDADILEWWEGIQEGNRSDALRDVIRAYLGLPSKARRAKVATHGLLDLPELVEVRQDTRWLVNALNDMPAYLERVIQRVASAQPVVNQASTGGGQAVGQSDDVLTEEQIKRRTSRLRKATW